MDNYLWLVLAGIPTAYIVYGMVRGKVRRGRAGKRLHREIGFLAKHTPTVPPDCPKCSVKMEPDQTDAGKVWRCPKCGFLKERKIKRER